MKSSNPFVAIAIVLSCTGALLTQILGTTSMAIALPVLGQELDVQVSQLQWLVSAYALSSGCFLLLFGRIADLHGRKRTFCGGMMFTLAFTLGCAFTDDFMILVILRAFQGVGLAAAVPSALGILAYSFKEGTCARSFAFATFAAGAPLGGCLGSVAGGALVEATSQTWRSTFYLTAGLISLFLLLGLLVFDNDVPTHLTDRRVDWIGSALVTSALVLIVFAFGQAELEEPRGCGTPYILTLLIVGLFLLAGFAIWQRRLEQAQRAQENIVLLQAGATAPEEIEHGPQERAATPPLMKLGLLARAGGRYGVMIIIAFLLNACFHTWLYWSMLFYQEYMHLSPLVAAVRFIPMAVTGLLCNVFVAFVIGRLPLVFFLCLGTGLTSVAALLYAIMDPQVTYWAYQFPSFIVSVFGADFIYAAGALYVAHQSLLHEQSVSGALFQTVTQLGMALGASTTAAIYDSVIKKSSHDNILNAYRAVWWACMAFGMAALLLSVVFFQNQGILAQKNKGELNRKRNEGEVKGTL